MIQEKKTLVLFGCLGIIILGVLLLSIGQEEVITPKDMTRTQLIDAIQNEETVSPLEHVQELLTREPQLSHEKKHPAHHMSLSVISKSLSSASITTRQSAFKTLITFPDLQKSISSSSEENSKNLKETVQLLNEKIGRKRYTLIKKDDHYKIRTDYILQPLKVQPRQ